MVVPREIDPISGALGTAKPGAGRLEVAEADLRLSGAPAGNDYRLTLMLLDGRGVGLAAVARDVPREQCVGGLGLVNNFSERQRTCGRGGCVEEGRNGHRRHGEWARNGEWRGGWFAGLRVSGVKVDAHPERTFVPLLFSQYTLSAAS